MAPSPKNPLATASAIITFLDRVAWPVSQHLSGDARIAQDGLWDEDEAGKNLRQYINDATCEEEKTVQRSTDISTRALHFLEQGCLELARTLLQRLLSSSDVSAQTQASGYASDGRARGREGLRCEVQDLSLKDNVARVMDETITWTSSAWQ
jgi:hypothetical protein